MTDDPTPPTDLIRSLALSEAGLRNQVLGHLHDIETELDDLVATIHVSRSPAVVAAPTAAVTTAMHGTPAATDGGRGIGAVAPQRPPVWAPAPGVTSGATLPQAPAPRGPSPAMTAEESGGGNHDERVPARAAASPPPVWVPAAVTPAAPAAPAAPVKEHAPQVLVREDPVPPGQAAARGDERTVVATKSRIAGSVRVLQVLAISLTAAAALILAAVVIGPRFLPYRALIVRSGSMQPTIPTGSVAFYRQEKATQVRVGQIILFSEPGDANIWITHRVVRIGDGSSGRFFLTKGDANAEPDPWRVPAEGTGWVVSYHLPYIGYALSTLSDGWARWVLIAVPAFSLAFLLLLQLVKGKQGDQGKQGGQRDQGERAPPEVRAA